MVGVHGDAALRAVPVRGVTRTYSPPPCPGRTAPTSTGSGRSRSTWCCSSTRARPWADGGFIGVDLFFVLSGLPRHQRASSARSTRPAAAAGPLLRPTGPPAAPGRARRHRRDQPAVRADASLGPPAADRRRRAERAALLRQLALPGPDRRLLRHRRRQEPVPALLVARRSRSSTTSSSRCCCSWLLSRTAAAPHRRRPRGPARAVAGLPAGTGRTLDSQPRLLRHRRPAVPAARRRAAAPSRSAPGTAGRRPAPPASSPSPAWWACVVLGSGLVDLSARRCAASAPPSRRSLVISGLVARPGRRAGAAAGPSRPGLPRPDLLRHLPLALAGDRRRSATLLDAGPGSSPAWRSRWRPGWPPLSYEVLEMPIRRSKRARPAAAGGRAVAGVGVERAGRRRPSCRACCSSDRSPRCSRGRRGPAAAIWRCRPRRPRPDRHRWRPSARTTATRAPGDARHRREVHGRHGTGTARAAGGRQPGADARPGVRAAGQEHDLTLSLNVLAGCPWQEGLTNASRRADSSAGGRGPRRVVRRRAAGAATRTWSSPGPSTRRPRGVAGRAAAAGRPAAVARDRDPADHAGDAAQGHARRAPHAGGPAPRRCRRPSTRPTACPPPSGASRCAVGAQPEPSPTDGYYATAAARHPGSPRSDLNPAFCPDRPGVRRRWSTTRWSGATTTTSRRATPWPGATRRGTS